MRSIAPWRWTTLSHPSGNGFLLEKVRGQPVPCRFCGAPDGDGHLFWECTFPPLVEIRESPEFHDLMGMDNAHWLWCLRWHGWLPMLSGVNGASPWAADATESAVHLVEVALGRYFSGLVAEWSLRDGFDAGEVAARMPDAPEVWSDGRLVLDQLICQQLCADVGSVGFVCLRHLSCVPSCRGFSHTVYFCQVFRCTRVCLPQGPLSSCLRSFFL